MFKPIAGTAILVILFTITSTAQPLTKVANDSRANGKPEELLPSPEAANAIERLGALSPAAIRELLKQMRRPAYLPGPALVNRIVELQHLPIAESKRVDQLKTALQPALDYHERGKMPIYVLRSEQPKAYVVERSVIIITTRMMVIASDCRICKHLSLAFHFRGASAAQLTTTVSGAGVTVSTIVLSRNLCPSLVTS